MLSAKRLLKGAGAVSLKGQEIGQKRPRNRGQLWLSFTGAADRGVALRGSAKTERGSKLQERGVAKLQNAITSKVHIRGSSATYQRKAYEVRNRLIHKSTHHMTIVIMLP